MLTKTALLLRVMNSADYSSQAIRNEVLSLTSEGYVLRFATHTLGGKAIAKLFHATNGNTMVISTTGNQITLKKNGKIVKQYEV